MPEQAKTQTPATDDVLVAAIRQAVRQPLVIETLCKSLEEQLRQQLGGSSVYIGKRGSREQLRERDRLIAAEFRGNNYDELAKRWGLNARHVRRIVGGGK